MGGLSVRATRGMLGVIGSGWVDALDWILMRLLLHRRPESLLRTNYVHPAPSIQPELSPDVWSLACPRSQLFFKTGLAVFEKHKTGPEAVPRSWGEL